VSSTPGGFVVIKDFWKDVHIPIACTALSAVNRRKITIFGQAKKDTHIIGDYTTGKCFAFAIGLEV